jgi:FkbM family methyltransferase
MIRLVMKRPFSGVISYRGWGSDPATFKEIVREEVYRCIVDRIPKDCEYIVDLGAHIGLATRYLADKFANAKICSVEPCPENFALLSENVADLVRAGRCTTLNRAAWNKCTQVSLSNHAENARYSSVRVVPAVTGSNRSIRAVTVLQILEEAKFPRIDLLKIDIEGAESELFSGNVDWLQKTGVIAIEFHGEARAESRFDQIMATHGFDVADANSHTTLAINRLVCR